MTETLLAFFGSRLDARRLRGIVTPTTVNLSLMRAGLHSFVKSSFA